MKAYLLINCKNHTAKEVTEFCKTFSNSSVHRVYGPYDVIAGLFAEGEAKMREIITDIRANENVVSTMCLSVLSDPKLKVNIA